jgi:hypothetical protein
MPERGAELSAARSTRTQRREFGFENSNYRNQNPLRQRNGAPHVHQHTSRTGVT